MPFLLQDKTIDAVTYGVPNMSLVPEILIVHMKNLPFFPATSL
jgi:hypothetical protein